MRQKLRPVPFQLRDAVSSEIKKQIELDIMERVTDERQRLSPKTERSTKLGTQSANRPGTRRQAQRETGNHRVETHRRQQMSKQGPTTYKAQHMTNDLLVFGKTEEEHQRALLCGSPKDSRRERGPTLNLDKCHLYQKEGASSTACASQKKASRPQKI